MDNLKDLKQNKIDTGVGSPRYERFSAILLLIAGFVYLALWLISIFSETTSFINVYDDKVSIKMSEIFGHLRSIITIGLSLAGGLLIYKQRRAGWVLGTVVLTLLLIICCGTLYQAIKLKEPILIAVTTTAWLILLLAILFLTTSPTRKRFKITNLTIATTIILALILATFYFFVQ